MLFDVGFVLIQQLTLGSSSKSSPGGIEAIFHYYHIIFPVYGEKKSLSWRGNCKFLFVLCARLSAYFGFK